MSGICSAHQHHEPGCPRCEAMGRTVTAIDRLKVRPISHMYRTPELEAMHAADLAAVEALYQAAKRCVIQGADVDSLDELDAAVRRVEAAQ